MPRVKFAVLLFASSLLVAQKPGWQPSFTEDFETTELNLAHWTPRDPLKPALASSPERVNVSGGRLHMSGPSAVSTFGLFAQSYGRFEMRFLAGRETLASFRLMPIPLATLPAITVFGLSGQANKITFANVWGTPQTERSFGDTLPVPGLISDFHTVTVVWERDRIVWMLDGKEKLASTEGIASVPAWLLIELTSGALDIDYIRVWHHADGIKSGGLE